MKIEFDARAILIERINRFLARVKLKNTQGQIIEPLVHVRDPGRLEDLLFPGNELLIKHKHGKKRKTEWEALFAKNGTKWVLINSGFHRKVSEWAIGKLKLFNSKITDLLPEQRLGESRIDFMVKLEDGSNIAVETKGCTLAIEEKALFPDAPTKRGTRHVSELLEFVKAGNKGLVLFLIFRTDAKCFAANRKVDPDFADVLERAYSKGVQIVSLQFSYDIDEQWLCFERMLPLCNKMLR